MTVTELAENVLVVDVPMSAHLSTKIIALTGERTVLIDSGTKEAGPSTVLACLRERRVAPITEIFCTHFHHDHIGGLTQLVEESGAVVLAHAAECGLIRDPSAFAEALSRSGLHGATSPSGRSVNVRAIWDGYSLEVGGRRWEALHVPGHSWGHLVFWNEDERILIAGDAVQGVGVPFRGVTGQGTGIPYYVDPNVYLDSLDRMRALRPEVLVTAHENPAWDGTILRGQDIDSALSASAAEVERIDAMVRRFEKSGLDDVEDVVAHVCHSYETSPTLQAAVTVRAHLARVRRDRSL